MGWGEAMKPTIQAVCEERDEATTRAEAAEAERDAWETSYHASQDFVTTLQSDKEAAELVAVRLREALRELLATTTCGLDEVGAIAARQAARRALLDSEEGS